jgi:hypothetical protein
MAQTPYPQMVRIRNDGDETFQFRYAGQRYNLASGAETFIPWEAMCLWFGHPFAVDVPGDKRKRYRTDELRRLYVKYGVYENHHEAAEKFPKISVWDITNGERITTVVDDPEGKNLNEAVITQADNEGLQRQIKAMQEQMAMMQAQLAASQNPNGEPVGERTDVASARPEIRDDDEEVETGDAVDDIPTDGPTRPKAVAKAAARS